uniref:Uncharacterized protein n=1 Tax=uncultured beta proteobacterium TaxID=86027 RepID=H5SEZ5_9PROT|nr:hypothetical protein HGMM_F18H05C23 [uncultured beta proteobacterium]
MSHLDEHRFRAVVQRLQPRQCPFAQALDEGCGHCPYSDYALLAERQIRLCRHEAHHELCFRFLKAVRVSAVLVLKLPPPSKKLTHRQALRLQCGALAALRQWLESKASVDTPVAEQVALFFRHSAERPHPFLDLIPYLVTFGERPISL